MKTVSIVFIITISLSSYEVCLGQMYPLPPAGLMAGQAENPTASPEPGLLFYLSGENEFTADFAVGGQDKPNFLRGLKIISDGAIGKAFEADDSQLMSYWAPGNIFAQRGTVSFFWRSRYPVGPTPFPVFRVAYADHSSWDMVWLRIDYNGSGFDAFVTDIGLTRTRVSHYMDKFPAPVEWTHITFSWDETEGVRFYINGELVEKKSIVGKVFDTGLDQFGPHSRIISPYQVQSAFSYMRGGDLDELRIYDRMLSDCNIAGLARGETPKQIPNGVRDLSDRRWRDKWWDRHGWNLPNEPPPLLTSKDITIRKVSIHDAYDIKRWTWKANDGIRETTWPGVYNMSRLPGRYDYSVFPDWDCYSMSGQSINFHLPDEPWNHVEVWGSAWGQLTHEKEHAYDYTFGVRNKEQIKSYQRLREPETGGKLRFDNALIEEPVGELGVYYVHEGNAPTERERETFTLYPANNNLQNESLKAITAFIDGRYPADERTKMLGLAQNEKIPTEAQRDENNSLPFIHVLIPYKNSHDKGLDGVEIELPALHVVPTHQGIFPMNIRVKDPLWPMRDLADFSFSIKPNSPHTLWIDTRDCILPEGRSLYITLAGADNGLTADALKGAKISLIYKNIDQVKPEHELDRFTQVRDLYSHIVEEHPSTARLNLFNRFMADLSDLLKANPEHWLARAYKYAVTNKIDDRPGYDIKECPVGIPEWAFLQTEYLRHVEMIIEIADGLLAHQDEEGNIYSEINFSTGEVRGQRGTGRAWPVFMAAYEFTGDSTYLAVVPEKNLKSREFDRDLIETFYTHQIKEKGVKLFIETEGSIWIDRVNRDHPLIQEHRLGGVALIRANHIYQQNYVSWNFNKPATYESLALFLPKANSTNIDIIAYNLEQEPVNADMTLWDIKPGRWRIIQGLYTNDDLKIDTETTEQTVYLERGSELNLTFVPRKNSIVNLELVEPAQTGYWERPDLAISCPGIKIEEGEVNVRVYSQGAIGTPETTLELRDANGELIKTVPVPALDAPLDLIPKWVNVKFAVPVKTDLSSGSVVIDPDKKITQMTRRNTVVMW